jgi:hypothetical protein
VFEIMQVDKPLDEDDELLSFGPHFGEEAARKFINCLQKAGWCITKISLTLLNQFRSGVI